MSILGNQLYVVDCCMLLEGFQKSKCIKMRKNQKKRSVYNNQYFQPAFFMHLDSCFYLQPFFSQGKGSFAYAWAMDESADERARGITMTVGVAYFDTKNYQVVLLDSPGHKDFVPNMISGVTQSEIGRAHV